MIYSENHSIRQINLVLKVILVIGVVGELIFFPSIPNFFGCVMAVISYMVFSYFFKAVYIKLFPFAFLMYLSMFMYRFLPLIATLVEGKPITYGFERPYQTFIGETILFLISSMAFYFACNPNKAVFKNNIIQKTLKKVNFYEINPPIIWAMGLIGFVIKVYNLSRGGVEYGDVSGKFLIGLEYLMFAPICLLFPDLIKVKYKQTKLVWVYTILVITLNVASNKRHLIITPFGTMGLLFFLHVIIKNINLTKLVSPLKFILGCILIYFTLNFLTNLSTAMLHTREVMLYDAEQRNNADKLKAFEKTIEILQDKSLMNRLKLKRQKKQYNPLTNYHQAWSEEYVDNFMLERYANMRITDETLYLAEKKGFASNQMINYFSIGMIGLIPSPILSFLGIEFNKSLYEFSRGDLLSGRSLGGYRVTSHVGDGLATFGYWYFPFQAFVFFIVFKLLNTFILFSKSGIKYAPLAIMSIFNFLGLFTNANGISSDLSYILRGYLQDIVTYLIILLFVITAYKILQPKWSVLRNR
ncbi:hypothetical protein PXD56_02825 [Maribacter sp. SA7]|uniref:hypothetical protein n=1 Tax=Maribacter zhoushanensis TaxID=3030012 RepID=UPI0023EBB612|nr:hypothetical protein [Maribacter zhoushanensis]MDF4201872.1 hypothetical protein [Maribacter zhoushanensis]